MKYRFLCAAAAVLEWLPLEVVGHWVKTGDLIVGDAVRQADGTTGMVLAVVVVQRRLPMYNLTVAVAHTFFVGDGACRESAGCHRVATNYCYHQTCPILFCRFRLLMAAVGGP